MRVLKPGGVLLCTLPAAGRISYEEGLDGDFWRFTEGSVRRLFGNVLPAAAFEVAGHGNVLACAAFLYGLAPHELTRRSSTSSTRTSRWSTPCARSSHGQPRRRRDAAAAGRRTTKPQPPVAAVLTYHRIANPMHEADRLCVPVDDFRSHLQHLRSAGYRVLPVAELVAAVAAGAVDRPSVALTFDDGYRDSLTKAAPVLDEFGFPSTFFLVGDALDEPYEFWWDGLERVFSPATDCRRGCQCICQVADPNAQSSQQFATCLHSSSSRRAVLSPRPRRAG